jgi:hypothetical protein
MGETKLRDEKDIVSHHFVVKYCLYTFFACLQGEKNYIFVETPRDFIIAIIKSRGVSTKI